MNNILSNEFFIENQFQKTDASFTIGIYLIEDNSIYGTIKVFHEHDYWEIHITTLDSILIKKIWSITEYNESVNFILDGIQYYLDNI